MLRDLFLRLGIVRSSALATCVAVAFSLLLSSGIELLLYGNISVQALSFAIAVPLMIAPIFSAIILRLVFQLEALQTKLREITIRDELTQAFNRRYWIELAEQQFSQAKRYGQVFSIAIMDVDDFKRVNDVYGHSAGDLVLRRLSAVCRSHARSSDIFARYGGEEFVFLLPSSDRKMAWDFCERIRQTLSAECICAGETEIRITVSIGVSTRDQSTTSLDELIAHADHALYAAKKNGKNQTMCDPALEA
jgi:diguanylate cyclase (GGDEF)-like protein